MSNLRDDNWQEMMAYYAEGLLSPKDHRRVAEKIARDPAAQESIRIQEYLALMHEARQTAVPESVLRQAEDLVPADSGGRVWDVVVHLGRIAIEHLTSDGLAVPGMPGEALMLRGSDNGPRQSVVLNKQTSSLEIQMEIFLEDRRGHCVAVDLKKISAQKSPEDLRVTLRRGDVELESHVARQGRAVFENIRQGRYYLEVTDDHQSLARISLRLIPENV